MNKKLLFIVPILLGIFGCDGGKVIPPTTGSPSPSPTTLPAPRLQEVYNCRVWMQEYQTSYVKGNVIATVMTDTKTGKEYIVTNVGGILEIK